ncbi:deSI-like protein At4g17486 isoform X1 [Zingiber officinale]|uniref:deSI-like protein At4g17486 isoform X1 n=1 Tax=Zingiber officinale TaxID=94328 RepID=UPI001C4A9E90|nr:deSI-like protein At4g17486 isoform X1 [Zingiber officinale]
MSSIFPRSLSEKALSNEEGGEAGGSTRLYLNVYDLTPANNYLYWFGIGVFHSGIEVHGMEYSFGAHDYSTSGVFEVEPKSCPGFIFRRSVWLGTTTMSRGEVRILIEELAGRYHGDAYHLIIKNCNHFTDEVCTRLTGKPIPGWVNRLARVGSHCSCILPENMMTVGPSQSVYLEDGSESCSSSDEEDADQHLLSKPAGETVHSNDDSSGIARGVV